MKNIKRLVAILFVVVLSLALVSCGGVSADKMIEKAIGSAANIESSHNVLTYDINIGMAEDSESDMQEMKINMNMDISAIETSEKTKGITTISIGGSALEDLGANYDLSIETYTDSNYAYSKVFDEWSKAAIPDTQEIESLTAAGKNMYLKNAWNFKAEGSETIGEYKTLKIAGFISKESMLEMFKSEELQQLMSMFEMLDMSSSDIEEVLGELMQDVPVVFWVDKKDFFVVRMEIDLSQIFVNMIEELADGESSASVIITMTADQINKVEDFEIPAEALNSPEL